MLRPLLCCEFFDHDLSFVVLFDDGTELPSLYSGKQTGPEPPIHLCLVQAGLVYGTPVMCDSRCNFVYHQLTCSRRTSAAGLAFVLYVCVIRVLAIACTYSHRTA